MNKVLDIILGLPGVIVFVVALLFVFTLDDRGPGPKEQCEQAGGRYVQTMKLYHTCKMPAANR